tara:strand:+ start:3389 stop:4345 length:957 start_codon:yes stop_codon:yes gene_type:complete
MRNDLVSVTDHIKNFSIERSILGNFFSDKLTSDTTIILVWHQLINKDFLSKFPSIRAIVRYGVGFDNIDLDLCKRKNIIVANTPDYGIDEVSDSALGMILYLTRKIGELENLAKEDPNFWLGKEFNLNMKRLNTLSLGIIGLGRIGSSIARKFLPFSQKIGFYDPYIPNGYDKVYGIKEYKSLNELLKSSDIVSINTPLNEDTKEMVDEDFLNNMREGSYLINLSRGPIIKNKELILEKLQSKHLEGYGTDVWTQEPPLRSDILHAKWKNNDIDLRGRIIINPHTAYFSKEALRESRYKACNTCLDIINNSFINNRIL